MAYQGAASHLPANDRYSFMQFSVSGSFLWTACHLSSPVQCCCMLHFANWATPETGQCKQLVITLRSAAGVARLSPVDVRTQGLLCWVRSWGELWDADRQTVCEWRRAETSGNTSPGFAEVSTGYSDIQGNRHPAAWQVLMKIGNVHRYLQIV